MKRHRFGKKSRSQRTTLPPPFGEGDLAPLSGAVAGAAAGTLAGPPGIVAGSILGAAAGFLAQAAMDREGKQVRKDTARLDAAIGVNGGAIGAASKDAPPVRIGAFSGGSMGIGAPAETPNEGPMQGSTEDE